MNILIYGGAFDPPHKGHRDTLRGGIEFLKHLGHLNVYVVPAWDSALKKGHTAPYEDRFHMTKRMVEDLRPKVGTTDVTWIIDDFEGAARRRVYTYDYVSHIREIASDPHIWMLVGSDVLSHLPEWHEYEKLVAIQPLTFLVSLRAGYTIPPDIKASVRFLPRLMPDISSTRIRRDIKQGGAGDAIGNLASSYIRCRESGLYGCDLEKATTMDGV